MTNAKPSTPIDLLQVDPKSKASSKDFSLVHLTAYSIHWLNSWDIATTYENISVLNARLFPSDFGMAGFPQFPDGLRTNRSLLQMRPKYRGLATSDPRKGVYLTEKGRTEVARVIESLGCPTFEGKPVQVDPLGVDPRRPTNNKERSYNPTQLIEERKSRLLFRRYKEGRLAETEVVHFLGLLGLYDHTPPLEVRREFRHLRDAAVGVHDQEFVQFLDEAGARFRSYLERSDQSDS